MSRVLHSWRGLWTRFVLKSRTLATFAARAGVLLDRAKHGSVLLENTAIGGDESTWTGQGWLLTFSCLGQQALGDRVRSVGDGSGMGGHQVRVGQLLLCHVLPFGHTAWGMDKLSYQEDFTGEQDLPSGFMTCLRFGTLLGSPWSSTSSSPGNMR